MNNFCIIVSINQSLRVFLKKIINLLIKKEINRGPTGIEPATSSTQRKNHTARPRTQLIYFNLYIDYIINYCIYF